MCASQDEQLEAVTDPDECILNMHGQLLVARVTVSLLKITDRYGVSYLRVIDGRHHYHHNYSQQLPTTPAAPKDFLDPISLEIMVDPVICGTSPYFFVVLIYGNPRPSLTPTP